MGSKPKFPLWGGPTKGRLAEDVEVYQAICETKRLPDKGLLHPAYRLCKGPSPQLLSVFGPGVDFHPFSSSEAQQTDE